MKWVTRDIVYRLLLYSAERRKKRFKRVRAYYGVILEEVMVEALPEVARMRSGVCPFCGRRFGRLHHHLKAFRNRNPCARALKLMADSVAERVERRIERMRLGRNYVQNKTMKLRRRATDDVREIVFRV